MNHKRRDVRLVGSPKSRRSAAVKGGESRQSGGESHVDPGLLASYDRLLDRFMPVSFLIDDDGRLLDCFGGAERLLDPVSRGPSDNLLDMLDGDVGTVVASAFSKLKNQGVAVVTDDVAVMDATGAPSHRIRVELVRRARDDQRHVLVTIDPNDDIGVADATSDRDVDGRARSLREELCCTRETLRATIADLERSNQHLLAANEELFASNEELQAVNHELHVSNITEREKGEEELRLASGRRERFLALLSHELRNPLAAVLNAVRIVSAGVGSKYIQGRARHVIDRQGRHMTRLLDDLLDVSRISSGNFEVRREQVRFDEVVTAAMEALEPVIRESGLTLLASYEDEPIIVQGDEARLQQVVVNLLSNAVRYSSAGSRVELSLRRDLDCAVLSVRDWGEGIEPVFLPHVFDMFARGEHGSREVQSGLGVGLALTRRIVELHHGSVEAKSDGAEQGSEFIVRIPCSTGRQRTTDQSSSPISKSCRIVLVEDQDDAREMMRVLFELEGHNVIEVKDGTSAVEIIRSERPDVAVVDIGLPDISGYDVARAVRKSEDLNHVFLIALTGYGSESDVRTAEEAGFDVHLTKPADAENLCRLLATRKGTDAP